MDAAVHEDAARGRREAHEEALRIVAVAGLRAHQKGTTDAARLDVLGGAAVAGVEAAHEADHRDLLRMLGRDRQHPLAVLDIEGQRLLDEDMLARAQRRDALVGVQRGGRDQHDRVDGRVVDEGLEVGMQMLGRDAELGGGQLQLGGDRAAGGDQLDMAGREGQRLGVAAAQPAQAGDADAQLGCGCGGAHRCAFRGAALGIRA